ncbi:MAG: hypothetical protein V9G15_12820 [Dermatophilaceae bacterium]|nr:hypothetical protein [Actinomycetales bacterium]
MPHTACARSLPGSIPDAEVCRVGGYRFAGGGPACARVLAGFDTGCRGMPGGWVSIRRLRGGVPARSLPDSIPDAEVCRVVGYRFAGCGAACARALAGFDTGCRGMPGGWVSTQRFRSASSAGRHTLGA